jgi:hypothetical protein
VFREQVRLVPVAFQFPWSERLPWSWSEWFQSTPVVAHLFQIGEANQTIEAHRHCRIFQCVAHVVAEPRGV